jgi:hypothetical protein
VGRIENKTLVRSALVGLFLTIEGMAFESTKSGLILHESPPQLGHVAGVTVCFLVAGFTFALGFFLFWKQLPGRTTVGKGLRYSVLVLLAVWISGYFNLAAIDFAGGWNLLSPAKIDALWMAVCDCLDFLIGGLVMGLVVRKDEQVVPVLSWFSAKLAARTTVGAVMLPLICAVFFSLAAVVLPGGFDLHGERALVFFVFLFAPLAISGGGTALLHAALRSGPRSTLIAGPFRITLFIFLMYWVPNSAFVLFLGFTWQVLADFLISMAASLYITVVVLETIGRARSMAVAS